MLTREPVQASDAPGPAADAVASPSGAPVSTAPIVARGFPQRRALNDEVHARPPERLVAPVRVSFVALLADAREREQAWEALHALAGRYGRSTDRPVADHYSADLGPFRVKAERHTEFVRFKFIVAGLGDGGERDPFGGPAIGAVPQSWLAELPGQLLVATHVAILAAHGAADPPAIARQFFAPDELLGATIASGAGSAFTDLRIREDGFGRLIIFDRGMTPGQLGRALQRLLEMDTYRMLALLAFPVARKLIPVLTEAETELASITTALVRAAEPDEPALLDRLTRLAAAIESRQSETLFRFTASASYYDLTQRRTAELREERIQGLQTFREFTERRLEPAMRTCAAVTARQEALSVRVDQATKLLATRVDLSTERQSHALLASMNRRAQLQLRLQETVEGLSVAAVTYYIVGLVGHAAEGLEGAGLPIRPAVAMGAAIPFVLLAVAFGIRRIRRRVTRGATEP